MIVEILVLIAAIPAGFILAWLARDELVEGREWFRIIIIASVVLAVGAWIFGFGRYISLSLAFIAIVAFISLVKSKDKKWVKRRI